MVETRDFHIGDILTLTTGRMVSPRMMDGLYDIAQWMAGESVWTHQLPRIMDEARPVLFAMYPQLANVDDDAEINPDNCTEWLAARVAEFGETMAVPKLNRDQHERIDPLSEIAEKVHPNRIKIVSVE